MTEYKYWIHPKNIKMYIEGLQIQMVFLESESDYYKNLVDQLNSIPNHYSKTIMLKKYRQKLSKINIDINDLRFTIKMCVQRLDNAD